MTVIEKILAGVTNADKIVEGYGNMLVFNPPAVAALSKHRLEICAGCEEQIFTFRNESGSNEQFKGTTEAFNALLRERVIPPTTHARYPNACGKCGCNLPAKTMSTKSDCPLKKWLKVTEELKAIGSEYTRISVAE